MEQVKAGATIDEEGQAINNVEKVLIANGIQLRDSLSSFRDMDDVLADVAKKYEELGKAGNTVAQGQILTAVAGTRQINIVSSLFDHWEDVVAAQKEVNENVGISKDRYEIFMQSIEAAANKYKAAWESVWQATIQSDLIKWFYDAGAAVGNFTSMTGGLIPMVMEAISALVILNHVKVGTFFTNAGKGAIAFVKSLFAVKEAAALTTTQVLGLVAAGIGLGIQVYSWIKDATDLNKQLDKSKEKISDISTEIEDLKNKKETINSLSKEFIELSNVVELSADQQKRYNDIQNELKELLPTIAGYYDNTGNFIITDEALSTNKSYVKLLQDQIDLLKERREIESVKSIEIATKAYEKNIKEISKINDKLSLDVTDVVGLKMSTGMILPITEEEKAEYNNSIRDLQIANNDYVLSVANNWNNLTKKQQAEQLKQIKSNEEFYKEFEGILSDVSDTVKDINIVPEIDIETPKTFDELKKSADDAASSVASTTNSVIDFIASLKGSNEITMQQSEQLAQLFPDTYLEALTFEGDKIKVNTEALRGLVIARAEEAVDKAQNALNSINADINVANVRVSTAETIIQANKAIAMSLGTYSETERLTALSAINAAEAEIIAAKEVAKAKGLEVVSSTNALNKARSYLSLVKSNTYWNSALAEATGNASSAQEKENEALEAYNDLLDMTIKMIKQQKEDQISALEDELDAYKKIIDAKKESLDREKEEDDYQKDLADKNKTLADIDNELLQLQFDNSEEGKKRRLELEEERADAVEDIDELQADRSYDIQIQALDDEYDAYKEQLEEKIKALEEYLDQEGTIRSDAISLLEARTQEFYNNLIEWNRLYGTGVDSDVIDKWAIASNTMNDFANASVGAAGTAAGAFGAVSEVADDVTAKIASLLAKLREMENLKQGYSSTLSDYYYQLWQKSLHPEQYHDGGMVGVENHHNGNIAGGLPKIKESEVFAKLLKGEVVATDSQMKNFINNTLPNIVNTSNATNSIGDISMSFNVAGNLDKTVLPDLKEMVSDALMNIYKNKGILRNASSYSI